MNQQVSKNPKRQRFHIVNIDAIRNPNPLSCEPLHCTDGFSYRGYSLNGIPVLIGDVLEYEKRPGIWQAVEYWPDAIRKRWFSEVETDAPFDLQAATLFRWPLKEAAHLVREHTKDRDAIKKKPLRS